MDCLFCAIVAQQIPSRQVYADDHAVAFLDVAPFHPGHTLVVPRRHVDDLLDQPAALAEIAPAIQQTVDLLAQRLQPDGFNLLSSTGEVAGQTVFHLHVHVVPRYASDPGLRELIPTDGDGDAVPAAGDGEAGAAVAEAELDRVWRMLGGSPR